MVHCEAMRVQDSAIIAAWQIKYDSHVKYTEALEAENQKAKDNIASATKALRIWRVAALIAGAFAIGTVIH